MNYLIIFLLIINSVTFLTYGIDKYLAIKNSNRISEKTLLTSAFFMGASGAFLGMQLFRHKTKKLVFRILVPLFIFLNLTIIYLIYTFLL